jgi:4'-phosphopantetheinyl transferase EntD
LAHVYNFSLTTLTNLLRKHGFQLIHGDETVRSISVPGTPSTAANSDHASLTCYIRATEKRRRLYHAMFRARVAVRSLFLGARWTAVQALRRVGLYNLVKRMTS